MQTKSKNNILLNHVATNTMIHIDAGREQQRDSDNTRCCHQSSQT